LFLFAEAGPDGYSLARDTGSQELAGTRPSRPFGWISGKAMRTIMTGVGDA